jgi:hypothetical protein
MPVILAIQGDGDRRIKVQDQCRQKLETLSLKKLGVVINIYSPSYLGGRGRRIKVQS